MLAAGRRAAAAGPAARAALARLLAQVAPAAERGALLRQTAGVRANSTVARARTNEGRRWEKVPAREQAAALASLREGRAGRTTTGDAEGEALIEAEDRDGSNVEHGKGTLFKNHPMARKLTAGELTPNELAAFLSSTPINSLQREVFVVARILQHYNVQSASLYHGLLENCASMHMIERVQDVMVRQAVPLTADAFHAMLHAVMHRFPFPQLADVLDVVSAMRMNALAFTDTSLLHLISALCLAFQTRQAGHLAWQALAPGRTRDPQLLAAISRTFGHLGMHARCIALQGLVDKSETTARGLMANHLLKAMLIKLDRAGVARTLSYMADNGIEVMQYLQTSVKSLNAESLSEEEQAQIASISLDDYKRNARVQRLVIDGELAAAHDAYQDALSDGIALMPLTTAAMMELCMLQQDAELGLRYVGAQATRDHAITETMIELLMRLGSVRPALHLLTDYLRRGRPSSYVLTVVCTLAATQHPQVHEQIVEIYKEYFIPKQLASSAVNNAMLWLHARAGRVADTLFLFKLLMKGQYAIDGPVLSDVAQLLARETGIDHIEQIVQALQLMRKCPLERELSGSAAIALLHLCRQFHDKHDVFRQQHMGVLLESVLLSSLSAREAESNTDAFAVGANVVRDQIIPIFQSIIFQHTALARCAITHRVLTFCLANKLHIEAIEAVRFQRQAGFYVDGACTTMLMAVLQQCNQLDMALLLHKEFVQRSIALPHAQAHWLLSNLSAARRYASALSVALELSSPPDDAFFATLATEREIDGAQPFPNVLRDLRRMEHGGAAAVRLFMRAICETHPRETLELCALFPLLRQPVQRVAPEDAAYAALAHLRLGNAAAAVAELSSALAARDEATRATERADGDGGENERRAVRAVADRLAALPVKTLTDALAGAKLHASLARALLEAADVDKAATLGRLFEERGIGANSA